ncbi:transposable element Tc1 transposase [Trichonephila clavipes]|nr:transposable element Tc1 transposase [Trichonephila clavipes]
MPGKRARRHFLQLNEFERGLIMGMKLQAGRRAVLLARWIVRSVPLEIVGNNGHEKVPTRGKPDNLAEANLKSKHPFPALPLTPEHRQLRLQWCQARSIWNVTDWQKVVFSDESRFAWGTDDNRVRVWRRPGPFLNGLPGAIFQQDNACPHTERVSQDFLRHFRTLPWPARTSDLSPVEHVWDQLKG